MAVDKANVRSDLVFASVAANEYLLASVSLSLGGTKTPIAPANFGEVVGYLQGARNFEVEIEWIETAPAVVRALLGFDASGTDDAPAVGTACPSVALKVWDPQDTNKLAQIIVPAAVLMKADMKRSGDSSKPATLVTTFSATRDSNGVVWSIGAGS